MIYLSIIVPVLNEEKYIANTLNLLINQKYPKNRYEIIVVDGMSTDKTKDIVKKFIDEYPEVNLRLIENPGRLSSRARNIGVHESKGKLIAVIDGHVYISRNDLFSAMESIKEDNQVMCLSRPAPLDVPGLNEGKAYWIAIARKSWLGHSRSSYIYSDYEGICDPVSSGFAYDRKVFDLVGGFDESFDAAEDVEFHYRIKRAGITAYTSPRLRIYSYPRESLMSLFKQQTRYGEGRARFVKKYPEGFTVETAIPMSIFSYHLLLPIMLIGINIVPIISISYFGLLILYWLILIITGLKEAHYRNKYIPGLFIALAIWITHMALGFGFLKYIFISKLE